MMFRRLLIAIIVALSFSQVFAASPKVKFYLSYTEEGLPDLANSRMPFPNSILWGLANGGRSTAVHLTITPDLSPEKAALYALINSAELEGVSPNAFISVPVSAVIDESSLQGKYKLLDLTAAMCYAQGGQPQTCGDLDETSKLVVRQIIASSDDVSLRFYPVVPLDSGHKYVFVLFRGIRSVDGQLLDKPAGDYKLLESLSPIKGQKGILEPVREQFAYLYAALAGFGISRDNTILVLPFDVASKTLSSKSFLLMKMCLSSYSDPLNVADCVESGFDPSRDTLPYDKAYEELLGLVSAVKILFGSAHQIAQGSAFCQMFVDYQDGVIKSFKVSALDAGRVVTDYLSGNSADLAAYMQQVFSSDDTFRERVPYKIFGASNYNGKLLMYQHGLGMNKDVGEAVNQILTIMGVPLTVLAIDLPWHGDRTPQVGPCSVYSGACFLTENIPMDRLNFYQAVVDQTVTMLVARAGCLDLNGDGLPGEQPVAFYYSGLSLGAITGSMFTSLNYFDPYGNGLKVDKAVLNVGGANYASLVDEAERFPIQSLICKVMGGEELGIDCNSEQQVRFFVPRAKMSLGYSVVLGVLQTLLDPSDPAYVVRGALAYAHSKGALDPALILQSAYHDTFVPNVSNEALARAFGFNSYVDVASNGAQPVVGWYMFGDDDHFVTHSFIFTNALYMQECGLQLGASYEERLSCLLNIYPELSYYPDKVDPDYIEDMMQAAWSQTVEFLLGQ